MVFFDFTEKTLLKVNRSKTGNPGSTLALVHFPLLPAGISVLQSPK